MTIVQALPSTTEADAVATIMTVPYNGDGDSRSQNDGIQSSTTPLTGFYKYVTILHQFIPYYFNIIAQPDLTQPTGDPTVMKFVDDISTTTVETMSEEILKEVAEAVGQVIANVGASVSERMMEVQGDITREIVCVNTEAITTATLSGPLGILPFE